MKTRPLIEDHISYARLWAQENLKYGHTLPNTEFGWGDSRYSVDFEKYDNAWLKRAVRKIQSLAKKNGTLTVVDFWAAMGTDLPVGDLRISGRAFRMAAKAGYIKSTNQAIKVRMRGASYWRPVWRSQIFQG